MSQDFSHQKLQGRSFKGQTLRNANFSHADIRGANFSNTILEGADFSHAIAGLQNYTKILLVIVSLLLAIMSGIFCSISGIFIASLFAPGYPEYPTDTHLQPVPGIDFAELSQGLTSISVILYLSLFAVFFWLVTRRGIKAAFKFLIFTTVGLLVLFIVFPVTYMSGTYSSVAEAVSRGDTDNLQAIMGQAWQAASPKIKQLAGVLVSATFVTAITIASGAFALLSALVLGVAVATAEAVAGNGVAGTVAALAGIIAILWTIPGMGSVIIILGQAGNMLWTVAIALLLILIMIAVVSSMAALVSWQTLQGNPKFRFLRQIAFFLAAFGGTNFQGAILVDTNFSQAILKSTDLRGAKLDRVSWLGTKYLNQARLGKTYLQNPKIQRLLVAGEGEGQNFERQQLGSINLRSANLAYADFTGASLSQSNLREADLSQAKLVRSQLGGADLTGACLTGAYIEDWGATRSTKLERVNCDYVYMRLPDQDNRDPSRMPPQGIFKAGQFYIFIRSLLETVGLYHNQEVNPKAVVASLISLAEEYQESFQIVALENRDRRVLIRIKTSEITEAEEIQQAYFNRYEEFSSVESISDFYQDAQLEAKLTKFLFSLKQKTRNIYLRNAGLIVECKNLDATVDQSRKQTTKTQGGDIYASGAGAFSKGDIYGSVANTIDQSNAESMTKSKEQNNTINQSRNININTQGGVINASGAGAFSQGNIYGSVANTINQAPTTSQADLKEVKKLLLDLKTAIEQESALTPVQKNDVLQEWQILDMAANDSQDIAIQKQARDAKRYFKGLASELPSSSCLVVEYERLRSLTSDATEPSL